MTGISEITRKDIKFQEDIKICFSFNNTQKPPPKCRVDRSLNQKIKWALYSFFRLFCTCRTCSPKPGKDPVIKVLEQKTFANHKHGRGNILHLS